MLHSIINDPKIWLGRAEEARAIGEQMTLPEAREAMFRIAKQYDMLADLAKIEPLKIPKTTLAR